MFGLLISVACLSGFQLSTQRLLKIPMAFTPLISLCLLGLILYGASLLGLLALTSACLMWLGLGLLALAWDQNTLRSTFFKLWCVCLLGAWFFTRNLGFHTIDEFVYWGALSKYLSLTGELPTLTSNLISKHLSYTPGLGLIHQLFHTIVGRYSEATAYFAQDCVLIACLMCLYEKDKPIQSILSIILLFSLTVLTFGTVIAKLQVDYLLALFLFVLATLSVEKNVSLFTLAPALWFLLLIKQIAIVHMLTILALTWVHHRRFTSDILFVLCAGLGLELSWYSHVQHLHLPAFIHGLNAPTLLACFNLKAMRLFVNVLLFGPANQLHIPFCLVFLTHGFLISRLDKTTRQMCWVFLPFMLIYLVMIYVMEVHTFGLGTRVMHTIGLMRYVNLFYFGFFSFSLFAYLKTIPFPIQSSTKPRVAAGITMITFAFVIGHHYRLQPIDNRHDSTAIQHIKLRYQSLPQLSNFQTSRSLQQ